MKTLDDVLTIENIKNIDFETLAEGHIEGKSLQEIIGIPDKLLYELYLISMEWIDSEEYNKAADSFFFLLSLDPFVHEYWMRLGNAEQGLKRFEEALEAYAMGTLTDETNPFPYLYSAQIYHHLNDKEEAKKCICTCMELINNDPELAGAKQIASDFKNLIEQMK